MLDKERIKEVMISFGKQVGYPERIGPREFIQGHLNDCFKILLMKKLVKPDHYNDFRNAAITQYQLWQIKGF